MLPACCSSCVKFIIRNLTLCMVLEKSRLSSHSTRQIFDRPKNLTRYFIHKEPFNIFSLSAHTQNWWSRLNFKFCQRFYHLPIDRALLTGKQSKMAYTSRVTIHPCNHAFAVQKFKQFTPCGEIYLTKL